MNEKMSTVARIASGIFVVGVLAAAVGLALYMKSQRRQPPQAEPAPDIARVIAPPLELVNGYQVRLRGDGTAEPKILVSIVPQVSGTIQTLGENFQRGGVVQAGDLLMQIDRTDYLQKRQAAQAQIDLLTAQRNRLDVEEENLRQLLEIERQRVEIAAQQLRRIRQLEAEGAATETDVDNQRELWLQRRSAVRNYANQLALLPEQRKELTARIDAARADYQTAQTQLDRTTIRSPISGRVAHENYSKVEKGNLAQAGKVYGEIFQPDVMEIPVSIPAAQLQWIPEDRIGPCGQPGEIPPELRIRAEVRWMPESESIDEPVVWNGCVRRIGAGLERQTRMVPLIVQVSNPANPDARKPLKRNTYVEVTIYGELLDSVFVLPRSAVLAPDEQYPTASVWLVQDDKLRRRPVDVVRYENETAILRPDADPDDRFGLAPGDRVVRNELALPVVGMAVEVFSSRREMDKALAGTPEAVTESPDDARPEG
jgi:multidrug efflux pump subunit AcrA (membrane-fusion protein)